VESSVQEPQPRAKHLTDAAIARALGITPPGFRYWCKQGCPNDSVEAARNWKEQNTRLTDAKIAKSLGVSKQVFSQWRKAGCPASSIEAAQKWRQATPYKKRSRESQQRFGNKNGAKPRLEKQVTKWGLSPTPQKHKLSPEIIAQVAQCISNGFTHEEIALLCDLNEKTVRRWCELAPIKKAVLARKQSLIQCITDRSLRDWVRYAWLLERKYPTEYSRPEVAHAIATANVTQNNLTQNLVISADIAKELTARGAAVRKQINQLFENRVTPAANQSRALPNHDGQPGDAIE
jgi:hypothetical protein